MKVLLAESVTAEVTGTPLPYAPWYSPSGLFVAVGGYADATQKESSLADTFGSMQWLWSDAQDFRFRNSDRHLDGFYLDVPEVPCPDPELCERWPRTEVVRGGLRVDEPQDFEMLPAAYRWADAEASSLVCLGDYAARQDEDRLRLRVAPDMDLLFADRRPVGWMLTEPARYMTEAWEAPVSTPPEKGTSLLLGEYLAITSEPNFDKITDGDEAACRQLRDLEARILAYPGDGPRMSVLAAAVRRLVEDWC